MFTRRMKSFNQRKMKRAEREAKVLAAKDRRAWFLVAGVVGGVAVYFLILAWGFVPRAFPERLVKAQAVHARASRAVSMPPKERTTALAVPAVAAINDKPQLGSQAASQAHPGYFPIEFRTLSGFSFTVTDQMAAPSSNPARTAAVIMGQIPTDVQALDEKPVSLKGFMLPVRLEGSLTSDFLLLKNQSLCCYGVTPKITEWVNVLMKGGGVKVNMDQPVVVCGTFHVGELRENGELVGIYRLDGDMIQRGKE